MQLRAWPLLEVRILSDQCHRSNQLKAHQCPAEGTGGKTLTFEDGRIMRGAVLVMDHRVDA